MRRVQRPIVVALVATCGTLVAGCKATYTVDVLNSTSQSIQVRLMQDLVAQDAETLHSEVIPAGERVTIGPVRATITDDVDLHVGQPSEIGIPDNHVRLYPGASAYEVMGSNGGWSGVQIVKMKK